MNLIEDQYERVRSDIRPYQREIRRAERRAQELERRNEREYNRLEWGVEANKKDLVYAIFANMIRTEEQQEHYEMIEKNTHSKLKYLNQLYSELKNSEKNLSITDITKISKKRDEILKPHWFISLLEKEIECPYCISSFCRENEAMVQEILGRPMKNYLVNIITDIEDMDPKKYVEKTIESWNPEEHKPILNKAYKLIEDYFPPKVPPVKQAMKYPEPKEVKSQKKISEKEIYNVAVYEESNLPYKNKIENKINETLFPKKKKQKIKCMVV